MNTVKFDLIVLGGEGRGAVHSYMCVCVCLQGGAYCCRKIIFVAHAVRVESQQPTLQDDRNFSTFNDIYATADAWNIKTSSSYIFS